MAQPGRPVSLRAVDLRVGAVVLLEDGPAPVEPGVHLGHLGAPAGVLLLGPTRPRPIHPAPTGAETTWHPRRSR